MKPTNTVYTLISMGVLLTLPVLASASGLQYSEENRKVPASFILKVQERPEIGGKGIYSYDSELLRKPELFRESRDRSSDTDMRSYSDSLGPSLDMPDSVNGNSRMANPWWERRSSADPMVQDLSRMDGGGFSSSGSGGGSVPGYHGR